jgi:hypothetical protein
MQNQHDQKEKPGPGPYGRLAIALAASYVVMFVAGYARSDTLGHALFNLNRLYMTGLMVAPMLLVMLVTMGSMFKNRRLNLVLVVAGVVLTGAFLAAVRTQAGVGDQQFLRSMIPHHSAAILVCQEASLTDPRIEQLCREIIDAQRREIREMRVLLDEGR